MEDVTREATAPVQDSGRRGLFRRGTEKPGGKPGKRKAVLLLAAAVVVVAGAVIWWQGRGSGQQEEAISFTEAAVERRSITKSLTSSGTLEPADSYVVSTLVSGEILSDTFQEGDLVEKDQLLYTLDSSDADTTQSQAQNSLTQAQNSLNQAQRNYAQTLKAKYPSADMSGTVEEVYVRNGDTVSSGTQLLKIVGDKNLTVDFLFSYADPNDFYVGQTATIFVNGFTDTITGTVAAVSSSSATTGNIEGTNGRQVVTVRVKASNPGLVTSGYTASAVIGSYISYGESTVNVAASSIITASTSVKVERLELLAGDTVSQGDRICTITGDGVDDQIDSAQNSIDNAQLSLDNAQTNLRNAQEKLDDYNITAPISGTVVTKTAKAGDKVEGGSTGTLCTIYDLSYLEMTMDIDELDIGQVAVGQTVQVTADAVPDQIYTGTVTRVSVAGTTSGGITTYPVTVRIDETDGLRPGMNVDAEIVIESRDDVLAVPSGAVNRGDTVLVTSDSPSAANALDQEAAEGYVYVQVETGVSDDSYTEILSGLQEGDTVAYIAVSGSSSGMGMMGGMPGGMGGGMPGGGGGMPSGGMGGGPGGGF